MNIHEELEQAIRQEFGQLRFNILGPSNTPSTPEEKKPYHAQFLSEKKMEGYPVRAIAYLQALIGRAESRDLQEHEWFLTAQALRDRQTEKKRHTKRLASTEFAEIFADQLREIAREMVLSGVIK